MPDKTLKIKITGDNAGAIKTFDTTTAGIQAMCRDIAAQIKGLLGSFKELNGIRIDQGVLEGSAGIERSLSNVTRSVQETRDELKGLAAVARDANQAMGTLSRGADGSQQKLLKVGTAAKGAVAELKTLSMESDTAARQLTDLAAGGNAAKDGLVATGDGAKAAQRALSSLNRVAGNTLLRINALSSSKFDSAGIVTGANQATAAIQRTRAAARMPINVSTRGSNTGGGTTATPSLWARAGRAGLGLLRAGSVGITALAGGSAYEAARFDNSLQGVVGNTDMSPAQQRQMRATVLRLMRTGTSAEALSTSFMRAENFGFYGKDADRIVEYSNKLGIGTHAPVDETTDVIAGLMNAYARKDKSGRVISRLPATAANISRIGSTMHASAIQSNMTLAQLEKSSSRTFGTAFAYDVAPDDAGAVYAALVQHRLTPSRSDTQVSGMLQQIAAPSPKALKEAQKLGIGDVFNATGLSTSGVGLMGVLGRVREAIRTLPKDKQATALKDLFNNRQGGFGATLITGAAWDSVQQIRNGPHGTAAAWQGKVDFANPLFQQQMQQPMQRWAALKGTALSDFIPLGEKLLPIFEKLIPILDKGADSLSKLLGGFTKLPQPVQEFILTLGGLSILGKLVETFTGLSAFVPGVGEKLGLIAKSFFAVAGGGAAAEGMLGAVGAALAGPVGLAIAATVAVIAALALAWKNDWGHIREVTQSFVAWISPYLKGAWDFLKRNTSEAFGAIRTFIVQVWPDIKKQIEPLISAITAVMRGWWTVMNALTRGEGANLVGILRGVWGMIKNEVKLAWDLITTIIRAWLKLMNGDFKGAADVLRGAGKKLWDDLTGIFQGGVNGIVSLLAGFETILENSGRALWGAIVKGVKSAAPQLKDAVRSGLGRARLLLPFSDAKEGPFSKLTASGEAIPKTLAEGVRRGSRHLTGAMDAMSQAAMDRLNIRTRARAMEASDGSRAGRRRAAQWQDEQSTAVTVRNHEQKHLFDNFLGHKQRGTDLDHSAWANKSMTNDAFKETLEERIAAVDRFAKANAEWLKAEDMGNKLGAIRTRLVAQLDGVNAAMATAAHRRATILQDLQDRMDALALVGPGKYGAQLAAIDKRYASDQANAASIGGMQGVSALVEAQRLHQSSRQAVFDAQAKDANELADKAMLTDVEFGYKNAADAAAYFQGRVEALTAAGKRGSDEWIEAMRALRQFNQQVTDAQLDRFKVAFDDLKADFADPSAGHSLTWYADGLQRLIGQIDAFEAANPGARAALESLRADVVGTAASIDQKNVAQQFETIRNGVTTGGDKEDAISSLQALLPDTIAGSPLQAQIKQEIAHLSKGIKTEADSFWRSFMEPLDGALRETFDNLFKKGGKRKSGKEIFNGFLEGEGNALLKSGEDRISGKIQGALLGANGKGNPLSFLGGLFSGKRKNAGGMTDLPGESVTSNTIGAASLIGDLFSSHDKTGDKAVKQIKPAFKDAKASLLEGAMAVFGAAQALSQAMKGGKKKGGLFGAIIGGVIGAYTGDWMGGVGIGSQLGGALGFANGGMPPVGVPSIVGERGPELFLPRVPGTIIPNKALQAFGRAEGTLQGATGSGWSSFGNVSLAQNNHYYGDIHREVDLEDYRRKQAKDLEGIARSAVPG